MSDLLHAFRQYAACQAARVLTQMDRDPDSPTFGCFDRNYWHYKIRDFPSSILQQGAFTIEALRQGWLPTPTPLASTTLAAWAGGAVQALCRQIDRRGAVDEYYPFERSYPASAFGLYAATRLVTDWHTTAPTLVETVDWAALRRLTQHVAGRIEAGALNQQAAGLAGLALASRLAPLANVADVKPHADRLFAAQHPEGWFNEYGGPDFGYLTVTLDALADYYDATQDERAIMASDRAIAFLAQLVGADGQLPSTLNCRNTDYVVPYGLVRAAARNPLAAWLVTTLFGTMAQPGHFLWATDDRYHCHYVFASVVRSLPHLNAMQPPQAPEPFSSRWLEGCGYWIVWAGDRQWTAYVGARKGGLVRIHQATRPPVVDHGWRIYPGPSSASVLTSNWWSDAWTIHQHGTQLTVQGRCQATQFHVPTPAKHALLRLLAGLLGDRIIPFLKQRMIFRTGQADGPTFERTVHITPQGVQIADQLGAMVGAIARPSVRQNLRHVASADSFSAEEWHPSLMPPGDYRLDRAIAVQGKWVYEPSSIGFDTPEQSNP